MHIFFAAFVVIGIDAASDNVATDPIVVVVVADGIVIEGTLAIFEFFLQIVL